jgi:transposase
MKKIVRQAVGIDVAQKELVVSLGRMYDDWTLEVYAHKTFRNNEKGFISLVSWVKKLSEAEISFRFVMEATGVYHERLAYFLEGKDYELTIVLPNKISSFMKTLDLKTVTDKTASEAIARFGLERKLENWKRPGVIFKKLKQLTRERDQILQDRTGTKNQLHAENV